MRHFERKILTERYADHRPVVQGQVINTFLEKIDRAKFDRVLDVGCGSGHSTIPLKEIAEEITGTDVSDEMLNRARTTVPDVNFLNATTESLPVSNNSIDLITVCMAFHWSNHQIFLDEVSRVLKNDGYLLVYHMVFLGEMVSRPEYTDWHRKYYWGKYPNPDRNRTSLEDAIETATSLRFAGMFDMTIPIQFTREGLRSYLTTQSNIDFAITNGHKLNDIDHFLDQGIHPFFKSSEEDFLYHASASYAKKIEQSDREKC